MKSLDLALKDLEKIVNLNIDKYRFPEIKGESIRISNILIRKSKKNGYVLVDMSENKTIETAYSKSGAIAIALAYLKNKNYKKLSYYDSLIEKHSNDSYFYSYIISITKEEMRKKAILNRFEESKHKICWAKDSLDYCILEDIR